MTDVELDIERVNSNWTKGYHLLPGIINRFGLKVGVEIGVALGGHSNAILEQTEVECLYGIDPYHHRDGYNDLMNMPQEEFDAIYRNTSRFMSVHGARYQLIRAYSQEAAYLVPGQLDFVYIDAEHSYQGVMSDLLTWFDKVRPGGVISGHDWGHPQFPGVKDAILDFMRHKGEMGGKINTDIEYFWWAQKPEVK